ncbi:dihydrolipoyl dehydrogenase [Alcaligenes sp. SDU_A2]|uniref:dihydrolipoyl dehydrogenase n=1 Tax=Alcaligenes sp. SDU_A2 TaxID=3136634 RepID=UPI0031203F1C
MQEIQCDVAVIGAGTAGMTAYRAAKRAGSKTVLIESGPYGTMCARVGCMPSKLLIAAADAAHHARHTAPFGVHVDGPVRVDGAQVMARVRRERDRFVQFVVDDVQGFDEHDKLRGRARFLSDHVLQVDAHTRVTAGHIIVATGSEPVRPKELQALGARLISNEDVFDWQDLPQRVLVIGAGVIGLELGQALARLDVDVSIIARSQSLAGLSDPDVRQAARAIWSKELNLRADVTVLGGDIVDGKARVRLRVNGQEVLEDYDYVLAAAGRTPQLADLGLENTSAQWDEKGRPVYDRATLQLHGTPIYLAGDVNQRAPILHEAADDGRLAALQAVSAGAQPPLTRRAPMAVMFTDPQVAVVGTPFKALPQGAVVGSVNFANQGRARVMLRNQGLLHVYAGADGRFLGAEMVGPDAEHIGHLLAWSLQMELSLEQMLAMPFYHPVLQEGLRTALRQAQSALKGR